MVSLAMIQLTIKKLTFGKIGIIYAIFSIGFIGFIV